MSMDSAQLTAFAAVINEGSFEGAARRLHVTPSAISQRIKALEAQLGQIVVRRTRPSQPTAAGQVLVRLAGQLALLESEALAEIDGAPHSPQGLRIPVAVNADSLSTWFLSALAALPAEPARTFAIHQEDQDHSVTLLRDGSVMAAVTTEARPVQGCRVEALGAMRYLAVASPEFRDQYFAEATSTQALATGFAAAPMLVFNRKDALQERFAEATTGQRLDPPITYLPTSQGFADAARLGLGWGMVPEQLAQASISSGDLIEIVPSRSLDVPLYWQRWKLKSAALDALTAAVVATSSTTLGWTDSTATRPPPVEGR
jgi:LysR family transcriptional regulator (chromosome initiation inhibitor)